MGLFSRSTPQDNEVSEPFEDIELPSSHDLGDNLFANSEPPLSRSKASFSTSRSGYGIEDAIKLMKNLPRDNNEVVVTVVKKTLESTQIRVQDIIEDANSKETRIRHDHKTLEEEIKQLQAQIAQRNQQISDLLHDLKETTDVRQRLQLALELDGEKMPAKQATAPQTAASAPATSAPHSGGQNNLAPGQQTLQQRPVDDFSNPNNPNNPNALNQAGRRRHLQRPNP